MKASDIIKYVEDGGEVVIRGEKYGDPLTLILNCSSELAWNVKRFTLLPKVKKVKLFRYTFEEGKEIYQSNWTNLDYDHYIARYINTPLKRVYLEPIFTEEKEVDL